MEQSSIEPVTILVAEDNPGNQQVLRIILARFGFSCDIVSNGRRAVEKAQTGRYRIILMDVHMPEMGGCDAAKTIRALPKPFCDVPIIAVTADVRNGVREQVLAAGMNAYITKPIDLTTVSLMLQVWLSDASERSMQNA